MPPRASWKGYLRLSLVTFPVRLHSGIESGAKIQLNQLHKDTNRRLRMQMTEPELGPVDRQDIVKGYEYEKGKYVIVTEDDLEKVKLETNKTIELVQFVDEDEIPDVYYDRPYYLAPDGPLGEDAYRVIREAMKAAGKVGIGKVVMSNREHIVALRPEGKGFIMNTLRYANEVRAAEPFFQDIKNGDVDQKQLELAEQLIEQNTAKFDPEQFTDRYQDALLNVIKAKIAGEEPVTAEEPEIGPVINLMDALKQSLKDQPKKKPPAKSVKSKRGKAKSKKTKKAKRA